MALSTRHENTHGPGADSAKSRLGKDDDGGPSPEADAPVAEPTAGACRDDVKMLRELVRELDARLAILGNRLGMG